jgi:ABC-type dipeptide/oligopeptide/nickel transport system ATPase component
MSIKALRHYHRVGHDLDLIGRVADVLAVMYAGRVVETGPAAVVRDRPRHPYTRALHDAIPAAHPAQRRLAAGPADPGDPGCRGRAGRGRGAARPDGRRG